MNIAKENGHKVEAGEDVQMGGLNDQLSISNGTLGDDFESLLNDTGKTLPNGHSSCPLPSELSFQLSLTNERGTKKNGFFRKLFRKKSEDRERRDGQDKGEDDDKGNTSQDKDEGSDFLSFRRILRIHTEDEKTLSTSIENCSLSTPKNSPGTEIVFKRLFRNHDRFVEDSELISLKRQQEKQPGSPRQQSDRSSTKPPLPITSQSRKGTYHVSLDFVQSICDTSYGLVDVYPIEHCKNALRESIAEIGSPLYREEMPNVPQNSTHSMPKEFFSLAS